MTSRFAHQYEHLQTLQSNIRTAKCRIQPLLDGASSVPSIPKPVEALKHFEHIIQLYCEAVHRFVDQINSLGPGDANDKEELLACQWILPAERNPSYLRNFVLPTIRGLVKQFETPIIHSCHESSPSKATTSVQTLHEPITMSGNIVDDSNNDALSSHTEDQPDLILQPIGSNTCPVSSGHVPVLKTDKVSHIHVDSVNSDSTISSNHNDDNSNDIMTNDGHSTLKLVPIPISGTAPKKKCPNGDLLSHEITHIPNSHDDSINNLNSKPIPIPGTSPKKKSFQYFPVAQMPPSIHHLPRSMPYARRSNHRPFQARREGSRSNSIFKPSIHPFSDSISATKHPPNLLHYVSASIHNPNSVTVLLRRDRSVSNYKHLHDEPWPDDRNPSFNCIVVRPPFYCIP